MVSHISSSGTTQFFQSNILGPSKESAQKGEMKSKKIFFNEKKRWLRQRPLLALTIGVRPRLRQ